MGRITAERRDGQGVVIYTVDKSVYVYTRLWKSWAKNDEYTLYFVFCIFYARMCTFELALSNVMMYNIIFYSSTIINTNLLVYYYIVLNENT